MCRLIVSSSFLALSFLLLLNACGDDGGGTTAGTGAAGMNPAAGTGAAGMNPAAGTTGAGMGAGMGAAAPTFTMVFEQIIVGTGCNGGALCHGGSPGATGGNLSMQTQQTAYDSLVNQPAMATYLGTMPSNPVPNCVDTGLTRVVPGQPEMSLLYNKISQTMPPCGDLMPPTGMLPAAQIEMVRAWIAAGAMNN